MKKLAVWFFAILIMIGVSGCMNRQEANVIDQMVAHVNGKYDDVFVYKAPFGGGAGASNKKIICSSEKYPGEEICVILTVDNAGEEVITDNYLNIKYKAQTSAALETVLRGSVGGDFTLLYSPSLQGTTVGASNEMTFAEYAASPSSSISFTAIVSSSYSVDQSAVEQAVEDLLREQGICCVFGVIYFNGNEISHEEINDANLSAYVGKGQYSHRFEFMMDSTDGFSHVNWR